jgi:hypothetical protein
MKSVSIGSRVIRPEMDDFFLVIIEERKKLPEQHPHYLLLKIIANSLYGIFGELNKSEYGKNNAKKLHVFSGEHKFKQPTFIVETPGRWQFPPAAALITAGGRLILAAPNESSTPNLHRATIAQQRVRMEGWRQLDTHRPSHARSWSALVIYDGTTFFSIGGRMTVQETLTAAERLLPRRPAPDGVCTHNFTKNCYSFAY